MDSVLAHARLKTSAFELVCGRPWAILPESLGEIARIAQRRGEDLEALRTRLGRPLGNTLTARIEDGIAVIPLEGPIFPRANLMTEMSGATSLARFALDFQAALADPAVAAIALEVDSPGGAITDIGDMAAAIFAARATKPIAAFVSGVGASAAYWIASAAETVVVSQSALVGSIGVVAVFPVQEQPDQQGVRAFEIASSNAEAKRPDPRTEAGAASIRAVLDALEAEFVAAVARNRGVGAATVLADFGRGGVLVGQAAVAAGMADRVGTLDDTIAELRRRVAVPPPLSTNAAGTPAGGAPQHTEIPIMDAQISTPPVANPPPASPTVSVQTAAESAAAERARVQAILALSAKMPGHAALVEGMIGDGTSAADAAKALIDAEAAARKTRAPLERLQGDLPGPVPVPAASADAFTADLAGLPVAERCKAQWERSAGLQAEFTSLAAFTAFEKAMAEGRVKFLRRPEKPAG